MAACHDVGHALPWPSCVAIRNTVLWQEFAAARTVLRLMAKIGYLKIVTWALSASQTLRLNERLYRWTCEGKSTTRDSNDKSTTQTRKTKVNFEPREGHKNYREDAQQP